MLGLYHTLREESVKRARIDQTDNNEFGRYIETDWIRDMRPEEFANFNILAWWKGRQAQFPDHLDAQERIEHISSLEGDCLETEEQLYDVEVEAGYTISLSDEEIPAD
ncbi:hypothetical protein Tco_1162140 [Tanacetum coccineum]